MLVESDPLGGRGANAEDRLAQAAGPAHWSDLQAWTHRLGFTAAEAAGLHAHGAHRLHQAGATRTARHVPVDQQRRARRTVAGEEVGEGLAAGMVARRHQRIEPRGAFAVEATSEWGMFIRP